jgi:GTP cyclohydrolase II
MDFAMFSRDLPPAAPGRGTTMRSLRRAVQEVRAGAPVVLDGPDPLLLLAIETASEAGLAEFQALSSAGALLLLAPSRAAAIMGGAGPDGPAAAAVALRVPDAALTVATLEALADPTQGNTVTPAWTKAPPQGGAALLLAKLARLLPAMLAAPLQTQPDQGVLRVAARDLIAHRAAPFDTLVRAAEAVVPLAEAEDARLVAFRPEDGGTEHLAILIGRPEDAAAPLVRIHSECFTGDLLGSMRCDCGAQLHHAIRRMAAEGAGVLLYMAQEGRGIGLVNKLRAYALQDAGLDTLDANRALGFAADERSFGAAAVMLKGLGIQRVRLLTNNPDKLAGLEASGIEVAGRVSLSIAANGVNDGYLETKARRFGHLLE